MWILLTILWRKRSRRCLHHSLAPEQTPALLPPSSQSRVGGSPGFSSDPPQAGPGSVQATSSASLVLTLPWTSLRCFLPFVDGLASLWALITTLHTPLPITLLRKPHLPGPAFRPSAGRPLIGPSFSHVHLLEQSLGSGGCAAQLGPV